MHVIKFTCNFFKRQKQTELEEIQQRKENKHGGADIETKQEITVEQELQDGGKFNFNEFSINASTVI